MQQLEYITAESAAPAIGSVIWLHGLGADGHDFTGIVSQLNLPNEVALRFIFPHAPIRPVSINANIEMRAWYDIYSLGTLEKEDEVGIKQAQQSVAALIEQEIKKGIPSERIVLAGFSQGGAMALYAGLRYEKSLGGILALSTYLPLMGSLAVEGAPDNKHTPIMMMHGRVDPVLPMALGELTRNQLSKEGYPVAWHDYPMEHQVCSDEIKEISRWLCGIFTDRTRWS